MAVSRSTFQRILNEARYKVATALVNGMALQVEGGTFRLATTRWHCADCGHDWGLIHGSAQRYPEDCPHCGSYAIRERPDEKRRHLE
jgi:rubrerythrin